jgi:hypothetical protein
MDGAHDGGAGAAARELTVIELYRGGGVTAEAAAGFLKITPAEFLDRVERVGASAS